jgi:hypothetical protein
MKTTPKPLNCSAAVKEKFDGTVQDIAGFVEQKTLKEKGYEIAEIEFTLGIEAEGKVKILPVLSARATLNSAITIRIRKTEPPKKE